MRGVPTLVHTQPVSAGPLQGRKSPHEEKRAEAGRRRGGEAVAKCERLRLLTLRRLRIQIQLLKLCKPNQTLVSVTSTLGCVPVQIHPGQALNRGAAGRSGHLSA